MDGNGYPDVLVGAYSSDQTLLLRTRPVITIETQFTTDPKNFQIDPEVKSCPFDSSSKKCFQVKVCIQVTSGMYTR